MPDFGTRPTPGVKDRHFAVINPSFPIFLTIPLDSTLVFTTAGFNCTCAVTPISDRLSVLLNKSGPRVLCGRGRSVGQGPGTGVGGWRAIFEKRGKFWNFYTASEFRRRKSSRTNLGAKDECNISYYVVNLWGWWSLIWRKRSKVTQKKGHVSSISPSVVVF